MKGRTVLKSSIGAALLCLPLITSAQARPAEDMGQRPTPPRTTGRPADPIAVTDTCGLRMAARYSGTSATPKVREALVASVAHNRVRWIRPGTAITQDYRPDRLNIILDEDGRVMTMRCG